MTVRYSPIAQVRAKREEKKAERSGNIPLELPSLWTTAALGFLSSSLRSTSGTGQRDLRRFADIVKLDWAENETEAAAQAKEGESSKHLWEESWDDDDTNDDFSQQLKYVLAQI